MQPNPLTTAITPLAGNSTTSATQTFQFTTANIASRPVTNLYFAFDSFEGPWRQGTPRTPESFTGTASGLSVGIHILYAFATDGEEATSIMPASSPGIGGIAAYLFDELGISTNTALTADVNPASAGQQVTFTAVVFTTTTGTPAGSVSFFDGSTFLGNAAIDNTGHAALQTNSLALGSHSITAAYIPSPAGGFAASTSTAVNESILRATSTALASSAQTISEGAQVTFTATVTSASGGTPTGSVTFLDGVTQIGTDALGANGQAVYTTSSLAAGTHLITAEYSGDMGFVASRSATLTETIYAPLDFSVGAATGSSTSATVKAGQTAMYSLQLSLVGGAPSDQLSIAISCTGAPSKAICDGPSIPVAVTSVTPATVVVSVTTMANGLSIPPPPSTPPYKPVNRLPILLVLMMIWIPLWLRFRARAGERFASDISAARLTFAASVFLLTTSILVMSGCGGGSAAPPPVNNGTPAGTYTLTVTLTATQPSLPSGGSGILTHTQPLTLTVQ